ncbi:MAG: 6-carboxytetrahydropterin synthase [candidate division WOR-3 bacterium]|nr:6-carboxytetrahydropterin synthase [candidate division WOR-3 bacterium]MCX7947147.1 6-carboxytetrahydropterin synthase [candidate division WOR-3 bacterium]MDW8150203.1 6-carboxytetrahydropterin synthase [candidate division WOR-3 bacterium]
MKIFYKSEISSAHRIKNHIGKCRNLHGHNYIIEVEIESDNLDENGFIIDFSKIKEIIHQLDHKVILQKDDPLVEKLYDQSIFIMDEPPSCENIAKLIAHVISKELKNYKRIKVRVRESRRSYSEFTL